ncbi:MAG: glycosyltransferase family 4 protein [Chloroflexi bacterium]|nr:MAG: glycosyltransferase family 4 protein [Chloroflexota bacterium]
MERWAGGASTSFSPFPSRRRQTCAVAPLIAPPSSSLATASRRRSGREGVDRHALDLSASSWPLGRPSHGKISRGLGEAAAVRRLEAVPDDDLASLYSHCAAFVLPSLYEGFGLPLLEAMACGAPCIASDIPALREVGGDACIYVAPDDLVGIAEALTTVLVDRRLAAQMRTAALARSSQFSWIDCARKTLDAYEALVDA